jgi:molecular chaperone IbpA
VLVTRRRYRIVLAIAGFSKDDIEIVQEPNLLTVRGRIKDVGEKIYLHRGIAGRPFERQFDLADYVLVTEATMGDGRWSSSSRVSARALKPPQHPHQCRDFHARIARAETS